MYIYVYVILELYVTSFPYDDIEVIGPTEGIDDDEVKDVCVKQNDAPGTRTKKSSYNKCPGRTSKHALNFPYFLYIHAY